MPFCLCGGPRISPTAVGDPSVCEDPRTYIRSREVTQRLLLKHAEGFSCFSQASCPWFKPRWGFPMKITLEPSCHIAVNPLLRLIACSAREWIQWTNCVRSANIIALILHYGLLVSLLSFLHQYSLIFLHLLRSTDLKINVSKFIYLPNSHCFISLI